MFVPLLEKVAPQTPGVEGYVVLTDDEHMPDCKLPNVVSYEAFIAGQAGQL